MSIKTTPDEDELHLDSLLQQLVALSRASDLTSTYRVNLLTSIGDITTNLESTYAVKGDQSNLLQLYRKLSDAFKTVSLDESVTQTDFGIRLNMMKEYCNKKLNFFNDTGRRQKEEQELQQEGNKCLDDREYDKALQFFDKALNIGKKIADHSGIVHSLSGKVLSLINKGSLQEALLICNQLTELDPGGYVWFYLGYIYGQLGRYTESIEYYKKSLSIYPGDSAALGNMGWTFRQMGDFKNAITKYRLALEIDPRDINLLINLAAAYQSTGDYEHAEKFYSEALLIDPNNILTLTNRAIVLAAARSKEATSAVKKVLEILEERDLTDPLILVARGRMLEILGNPEEAESSYDEALKMDPEDADALYGMAINKSIQGEIDESLWFLDKAIKLRPALRQTLMDDPGLQGLKSDDRFKKLMTTDSKS